MNSKSTFRELELPLNKKQFQQHLVGFLTGAGLLHTDDDVVSISFDNKAFTENSETMPIVLKFRKEIEIEVEDLGYGQEKSKLQERN